MSCTDDKPCLAPMLRWVHSKTCQDRTRRPKPPPLTRDEALALVIQCARVCAMEGASRPDRWRLDDALKAYDRASPAPETRTADPRVATMLRVTDEALARLGAPETRTGEGAETPIVRSDWRCEAGTEACPGTQGSLAKEWICVACGRKAHAPKTWRDKGLAAKPPTYEPSGSEKDGEGPRSPSPREGTP